MIEQLMVFNINNKKSNYSDLLNAIGGALFGTTTVTTTTVPTTTTITAGNNLTTIKVSSPAYLVKTKNLTM